MHDHGRALPGAAEGDAARLELAQHAHEDGRLDALPPGAVARHVGHEEDLLRVRARVRVRVRVDLVRVDLVLGFGRTSSNEMPCSVFIEVISAASPCSSPLKRTWSGSGLGLGFGFGLGFGRR